MLTEAICPIRIKAALSLALDAPISKISRAITFMQRDEDVEVNIIISPNRGRKTTALNRKVELRPTRIKK